MDDDFLKWVENLKFELRHQQYELFTEPRNEYGILWAKMRAAGCPFAMCRMFYVEPT